MKHFDIKLLNITLMQKPAWISEVYWTGNSYRLDICTVGGMLAAESSFDDLCELRDRLLSWD